MWNSGFVGALALATVGLSLVSAQAVRSGAAAWAPEVKHEAERPVHLAALGGVTSDSMKADIPLTAITAAPDKAAISDRRVALVIGNAAYPDEATPLRHPVGDANAFADELRLHGFEVEVGENLTKQGMEKAIERFTAKITPGSTALVFYSGHGVQTGRQSYLVPVNSQIWTPEDVRRDAVSLEPLVTEMNTRGAALKLVVLDASRRNPFERRLRGFSAGLAPISGPEGTLILYSVAPGKVANDGTGEHSLFVGELLREMRAPALSAEEAFNRTRMDVARATNGEQVPAVFSSLTDHFYFAQQDGAQPTRQSRAD